MAAVCEDSGAASGLSSPHVESWTSADFVNWFLEQIAATTEPYGLSVVAGPIANGGWVLAGAGSTQVSQVAAGAAFPALDVSDDVLSLDVSEPANEKCTATLILDNHAGQYTRQIDPVDSFRVGARVEIELGYGGETVPTHRLYVDRIEHTNAPLSTVTQMFDPPCPDDRATISLHLSNRARRMDTQVHASAGLGYLVNDVAIAAGIDGCVVPATPQFAQTVDQFAISVGDTWRASFDRLARLYGFDWFVDESDAMQLREPAAGDPISFAYGTESVQPLSHSLTAQRRGNTIKVAGKADGSPIFADAIDVAAVAAGGEIVHERAADRMLSTAGQLQIRAGLDLRRAQRAAADGWIRLPLNPGHQPLDVIAVNDESLSCVVRLTNITWRVDFRTGVFEQLAQLEAP